MKCICKFAESDEEKAGIRSVWDAVFVNEQQISPELVHAGENSSGTLEIAALDGKCVIGTARIKFPETGTAKLERMAVLKDYRKFGVGKGLIDFILIELRSRAIKTVELHAQHSAIDFYRSCGFIGHGPFFTEAGILHIRMELEL